VATRITLELSDDELRTLEQVSSERGFASPADALRAGIPRVARAAAEREAIAEAYRKAYQARPQETELGEAGAELFAQIVEEGSQRR